MNSALIVAVLLKSMIAWQPIGKTPWVELRSETPAETRARYTEIAEAAVAVSYDTSNAPLFPGARGRGRTAALLISIAWLEGAFYNRVTTTRPRGEKRSDDGRSWCTAQILIGVDGIVRDTGAMSHVARIDPERWSGPELEEVPQRCLLVAYRHLRQSFAACRGGAPLGSYTGEGCGGGPLAENRLARAFKITGLPLDAAVMAPAPPIAPAFFFVDANRPRTPLGAPPF